MTETATEPTCHCNLPHCDGTHMNGQVRMNEHLAWVATDEPDRFCDHGTPIGSPCGRCAALGEMTANGRLFATAAERGVPPVAPGDADLSRIRVTYPNSVAEYERLHAEMQVARAERKARYDRMNGAIDLTGLGAL